MNGQTEEFELGHFLKAIREFIAERERITNGSFGNFPDALSDFNTSASGRWLPAGVGILDVEHLFDDEAIAELEAICPDNRSKPESIRVALLNIAGLLNAGLHFEQRPGPRQMRDTSLRPLCASLTKSISLLSAVDHDSMKALESAAKNGARDPILDPEPDITLFNPGPARLGNAAESMRRLLAWCTDALEDLPAPTRGRPTQLAKLDAVRSLAELWETRTLRKPTRNVSRDSGQEEGRFNLFCEKALFPVLRENGDEDGLEWSVRKVIDPQK